VGSFFSLCGATTVGAVVGHCGSGDQQIAGHRRFAGGEHVARADHVDALHAIGRRQEHRASDQRDLRAGFGGRLGQGEAHFARAVIGDVTHRVDVFLGRSGGDQQTQAAQAAVLETVGGGLGQLFGLEHAAHADIAAGLAAGARAEQADAALFEQLAVGLGRRVGPHRLIHRRRQGDRGVGRQHQGGQQVVGDALGEARHEVGSRWCDQHQVSPARQFDMAHRRFGCGIEQIQMYRVAGERLQGQRRDELAAALSHHHSYFGTVVAQTTHQLGTFVSGDAAADAQDDAFTIQPLHRPALFLVEDCRSENCVGAARAPRKNDGLR